MTFLIFLFDHNQAEAEREDKYFTSLEKKEAMEQKMANTVQIKVTVYMCKKVL